MASFVMLRSKVKDFKTWKTAYDAHASVRKEFGLSEEHVFKGADNSNEIVVLLKAPDLKRAKAFAADPKIQEAISKSGVIGKPDVQFLEKA